MNTALYVVPGAPWARFFAVDTGTGMTWRFREPEGWRQIGPAWSMVGAYVLLRGHPHNQAYLLNTRSAKAWRLSLPTPGDPGGDWGEISLKDAAPGGVGAYQVVAGHPHAQGYLLDTRSAKVWVLTLPTQHDPGGNWHDIRPAQSHADPGARRVVRGDATSQAVLLDLTTGRVSRLSKDSPAEPSGNWHDAGPLWRCGPGGAFLFLPCYVDASGSWASVDADPTDSTATGPLLIGTFDESDLKAMAVGQGSPRGAATGHDDRERDLKSFQAVCNHRSWDGGLLGALFGTNRPEDEKHPLRAWYGPPRDSLTEARGDLRRHADRTKHDEGQMIVARPGENL
ncbi:MAG: hypothetical protein FJX74_18620 [Armatimonadetes bacterium]|nr:hypothetical protein [Armatimonadota bacterium]